MIDAAAEIKPLPGKVALEAGLSTPTTTEGIDMKAAAQRLSLVDINVAASSDIPEGSRDALMVAVIGSKDISSVSTDPVLKPLVEGLDKILNTLKNNLKDTDGHGTVNSTDQIDTAIRSAIMADQAWKQAFNALSAGEQAEVIKNIRETGALSAGRRIYTEKVVIEQESGAYAAAKSKYEQIKLQVSTKEAEKTTVDTALTGKDRARIISDKESAIRTHATLESRKMSLLSRREALEKSMRTVSNNYRIRTGGTVTFNTANRDADPEYQDYQTKLDAVNLEIDGDGSVAHKSIDTLIFEEQQKIDAAENDFQLFERQDTLVRELATLKQQLATADGDLIIARTNLAAKINELMNSLNKVLPEAAKEGLNKYRTTMEQANREKQIAEAKKKAEDAEKEGNIINKAKAELKLAFERRYIHTEKRGLRKKDVYITDKDLLEKDFKEMLQNPDKWVRDKIATINTPSTTPTEDLSGFSPDVVAYLGSHSETVQKLADSMRQEVFISVSRQAVNELNLDKKSLETLCKMPDFVNAAEQAVTSDKAAKAAVEKLIGQKLTKGSLGTFIEKAGPIVLVALAALIFFFFGTRIGG